MSWKCYIVERIALDNYVPSLDSDGEEIKGLSTKILYKLDGKIKHHQQLKPGAMFESNGQIHVKLPVVGFWNTSSLPSTDPMKGSWKVTGMMPNITTSPSINYIGLYHGWVKDGVVTDDCEGRKFDEMGNKI